MLSAPKEFTYLLLHKATVQWEHCLACDCPYMWDRGQCRLRQGMVILKTCHRPNPLFHCISKTLEIAYFNTITYNQDSPFHNACHCAFFLLWISELWSIIIPSFPDLLSFNVGLNAQEEPQCHIKKKSIVLFHPAYKIMDL